MESDLTGIGFQEKRGVSRNTFCLFLKIPVARSTALTLGERLAFCTTSAIRCPPGQAKRQAGIPRQNISDLQCVLTLSNLKTDI